MTRYHELTNHLFSLNRSIALRTDLSGTLKLAKALGHPEKTFPSIHIAGTNGKGSVAFKIAESLRLAGYSVGLFTSPHLFTYRERIQISGEMISEQEVVEGLEKLLSMTANPTFFEITTLLAFETFANREVDVAVVETGLGGRLDATNILRPLLSIITSIDYDHMNILGDTLDAIAQEKAGIIKKGVPVVIGKKACFKPIMQKAEKLYIAGESNVSIAREALKHLPFSTEKAGLRKNPPCRFERHGDLIFDVAHNPAAFTYLFDQVKRQFPGKKIHVLLGMSKDKDIADSIAVLRRYVEHITLIPASHPRLIPVEELQKKIEGSTINTPEKAYAHAQSQGALTVVTGSFYIMKATESLRTSSALH